MLRGLALAVFAFLTIWATVQAHDSAVQPRFLQPSAPWTAAGALLLWVIGLGSWYLVRRGRARPVAVVIVASSAVSALLMSAIPLTRCTASDAGASLQDLVITPIWRSMIVFVGTTPEVYEEPGVCSGGAPLAVQIARLLAMVAVFGTATALGMTLANRQLTRVWARWRRFHDVVIGLNDDSMVVLRELVQWEVGPAHGSAGAKQSDRPKVLALFTEEQAANELQARALGVTTAQYDRERMGADGGIARRLTHYLTRRGSVAVDRVWVFDADPFTAIDIAESAFATLAAATAHPLCPPPKIWVVLAERQLADSIRVRWLARDADAAANAPIRTPVCPAETTAMELVGRVAVQFRTSDYDLVLCGDSDMAESLLVELATRLWEEADLRAAWLQHCSSANGECRCRGVHDHDRQVADLPNHHDDLLVGGRMPARILVFSPNAQALLGQVRHSVPAALSGMLSTAQAFDVDWRGLTPATWPARKRRPCAVIVAEPVGPADSHLGQRLISLTPAGSVVWMPSALPGRVYPQKARESALPDHPIQEYAKNLFLAGHVPEDAWNRIARHQHERYRRVNYNPDPKKRATRLAWWGPDGDHLDDPKRDDNLAAVRKTLAWFATHGFAWRRVNSQNALDEPSVGNPPFGMTGDEWNELLYSEYGRWTQASGGALPSDGKLPEGERAYTTVTIATILRTLQANGYEPVRIATRGRPSVVAPAAGAPTAPG